MVNDFEKWFESVAGISNELIPVYFSDFNNHAANIVEKFYHYNLLENNPGLVIVFEDEWLHRKEIVKSKLLYKFKLEQYFTKVYARKCQIQEIDAGIKNKFLDNNHLQGREQTSVINLGLFCNDELVAVMTFNKPNITGGNAGINHCQWNLSRYAVKLNYNVVGGFSKIFSYFIKQYIPDSVQTYADRRWSNGNLYEKNGFQWTHITKPNYWYISKKLTRLHRFNYRKQELARKLKNFDKTKTEHQNMLNNIENGSGLYWIWDCGNIVYNWYSK